MASAILTGVISNGICNACVENVCGSPHPWQWHHELPFLLVECAKAPCVFCSALLEDLRARGFDDDTLRSLPPKPIYRWNIRKLTTAQGIREIIKLTFQSVVPKQYEVSNFRERISSLPDRSFYFYLEQDLGLLPAAADLGSSTNSLKTWQQINSWMADCNSSHKCYRWQKEFPEGPTRLLDISKIDISKIGWEGEVDGQAKIKLVSGKTINEHYVTLSHRWDIDEAKHFKLTTENMSDFEKDGIDWGDKRWTKTFQHAILIARQLGKNYIWIDSLCIVQGEGGDFENEAPYMHKYYRFSYCNIGAADIDEEGLFRERDLQTTSSSALTKIILPKLCFNRSGTIFGRRAWRIVPDGLWDAQLLGNGLYQRGWVFQERMLSPRILHFSKYQVFWECSEMSTCEGLPEGVPRLASGLAILDQRWRRQLQRGNPLRDRSTVGVEPESIEKLWYNAVSRYTRCALTQQTDKLMAIWSVAKLVRDVLQEDFGAGLWSNGLELQLAWKVIDCKQADGSPSERINIGMIPSWSWASVNGMIEPQYRFRTELELEREYVVKNHKGDNICFKTGKQTIVDQGGTSRYADEPVKLVIDQGIAIRGYLRAASYAQNPETGKWKLFPAMQHAISNTSATLNEEDETAMNAREVFPDAFPDEDSGSGAAPSPCYSFVLAYREVFDAEGEPTGNYAGKGLMLSSVQGRNNNFRRTGAFHFHTLSANVLSRYIPLRTGKAHHESASDKDCAEGQTNFWLV